MFKYYTIIALAFILIIGSILVFDQTQENSVKETVIAFTETLKKKNIESLIPFVINEPDYVKKRAFEEFAKIHNYSEKQATSEDKDLADSNRTTVSPASPKFYGEKLVEYIVPTDTFFIQNRYFKEIVYLRENKNEARLRVKLGGWQNLTGDQLGNVEYDFFLYQEK